MRNQELMKRLEVLIYLMNYIRMQRENRIEKNNLKRKCNHSLKLK